MRKNNTTTVQHASVVDPDVRVVGPNGQELGSKGAHREALCLGVRTDVVIQIDKNIAGVVSFTHLRISQVKLPGDETMKSTPEAVKECVI